MMINKNALAKEVIYLTSRAGGSGGQHVNKVETKVILKWDLMQSNILTTDQKILVKDRLSTKLSKDGCLQVECSDTRSQLKNKEIALIKMINVIQNALKRDRFRIPTKTPKSVILDRLDRKKRIADKKQQRKKNFDIF
ncbi:aminoacyl-tRNA hydrolase [Sphingobacterium sp. UT-1RO-CII-1]|uniref:aminoacyl-tRNA hydrolase n=1 Tax=Sphingobacterium sp. UT-1RO-CII-1 TaxID=2995225 RepID=UPI00227B6EDF|nr:aminoacyl-tRNA hydrolase [Sphingobacterium sp. UT-1RO-CII-1]MCY4778138.1 aminoacyl-tRNA hydrolase [Sphingobacterium sp. UT-1RO-CII-1]